LESAVVFREKLNGAVVTAAPELLPSTVNCTLVVFEETLVVTATVPETVAPDEGEVIEIVGGVPVGPGPEPPQGGTLVLFVNGEATAQFFGCGGMGGGGIFCETGESACTAAASKVLFVRVRGSHPPPFQKLLGVPSEAMALAMLFETCTGPQGGSEALIFQT
jgi:hypothetical protein